MLDWIPSISAFEGIQDAVPLHRRAAGLRRLGSPFRAHAPRKGCAQARARPALSVRRRETDERARSHGHQPARGRRRPRRHAHGRGDRHRAGRRRLPAQLRRGAVRQFRTDPHLRRIWNAATEGWLPDLLQGRIVMALGISEPDAGSAATDLKTSAKPDGSHYVINGSKLFSSFSPDAAIFLIYVRYGPGVGGIGSVIVERGTPGFAIGQPSRFMSGEEWCELHFDNCRIPAENVVPGPGGFKKQMAGFNIERLGNPARSLAFGRYAFNKAREHASTRQQFGRPLCEFQGLQWKFADMAIKLEGAQLLLYRAAANADRGLPSAYETAIAKAACNQAGFEAASEAVQIMGATGYSQESLVGWCMRRCRGWMIAGGSVEILKNRIAEHLFDRRFDQRRPKPAEAAE